MCELFVNISLEDADAERVTHRGPVRDEGGVGGREGASFLVFDTVGLLQYGGHILIEVLFDGGFPERDEGIVNVQPDGILRAVRIGFFVEAPPRPNAVQNVFRVCLNQANDWNCIWTDLNR